MKSTPETLQQENALAERAAGYWLLGAAVVVLLPHVPRLPVWLSTVLAALFAWRFFIDPARLAGAQPLVALVAHRGAGFPALPSVRHAVRARCRQRPARRHAGAQVYGVATAARLRAGRVADLFSDCHRLSLLAGDVAGGLPAGGVCADHRYADSSRRARRTRTLRVAPGGCAVVAGAAAHARHAPVVPASARCACGDFRTMPMPASPACPRRCIPAASTSCLFPRTVAFRAHFQGAVPPPAQRYWRALVLWTTDGKSWTRGLATACAT